jgi:hypothetical protein
MMIYLEKWHSTHKIAELEISKIRSPIRKMLSYFYMPDQVLGTVKGSG